jgi:hypothetical protein
MTSLSRTASQNDYPSRHDLRWSRSDKAIARKAFDAALEREIHEVIQEAKDGHPDQTVVGPVGLGTLRGRTP